MFKTSKRGYEKRRDSKTSQKQEYGDLAYGYQGKPVGDNSPEVGLSVKAMKNLPKSSFSVQADPYTAALPGSEPYALLNKFNVTIGGTYGGFKNLDGGNVQQYANSYRSKFLHAFDFVRARVRLNYHYIPTESGSNRGKALIDEQLKAIDEAVSTLKSTTFTQMAIYDYIVETDMPMGSSNAKSGIKIDTGETITAYTRLSEVLYAALRIYQVFWLSIVGLNDWHNSFRLKMGTMIRSAWNREVARLNGFFGLMKKKSFLALWNSLCMSIPGEYIDRNFAVQFAKSCLVPSRRANALTEPVMELQASYVFPSKFNLYVLVNSDNEGDTYSKVFGLDDLWNTIKAVPGFNPGNLASFGDLITELMDYLSAEDTMKWARSTTSTETNSDTLRFNQIKVRLDAVNAAVNIVKRTFNDVREVLDTVGRTGLVTWFKGFRPSITKDDDAALFRNLVVDDTFKLLFGGANKVYFDSATKRYRSWSLWNMYDGIPEYDTYSGGAFLTFSLKELVGTDQDFDNINDYLPEALIVEPMDGSSAKFRAVNRLGTEIVSESSAAIMANYIGLRRLVPLASQDSEEVRVVTLATKDSPDGDDASDYSFFIKVAQQCTGMCMLTSADGSAKTVYTDPDILAIYQIEIEDITNEMQTYARQNAPFLGAVATPHTIGFLGRIGSR